MCVGSYVVLTTYTNSFDGRVAKMGYDSVMIILSYQG